MVRWRGSGWLGVFALMLSSVGCVSGSDSGTTAAPKAPVADDLGRVADAYGERALHFEPLDGPDGARYVSRAGNHSLLLSPTGATVVLGGTASSTVGLRFAGANLDPAMEPVGAALGTSNYAFGADPDRWLTGVPHFTGVRYAGLYPGIDLVFYGNQRQLEYDFLVDPGADPETIRLSVTGSAPPRLDTAGNLILATAEGELVQRAPVLYQEVGGARRGVAGEYALLPSGEVGFSIGAYDADLPLVIDPVLAYSTYLGGSGGEDASGVATDSAGNAYIVGTTTSADFPTANPQQGLRGASDLFVTKMSPSGVIVYSTYLGGSGGEQVAGIVVDGSGNAYVSGFTSSTDFPVLNPFETNRGLDDVFVTKLDASGALAYSTYVGGAQSDEAQGIAVDGSGQAYVAGYTYSTDYPTQNAVQPNSAGGFGDAFVTKLSASGSSLVYSTYLGSTGDDWGYDIAVKADGIAFVTGGTRSPNFPRKNAHQATKSGATDAFLTSFDAAGAIRYSTFLGGNVDDFGLGVATDAAGNAYLAGFTSSTTYPVLNPFQANARTGFDGFVTKLGPAGAMVYSTYLAGSGDEWGRDIAVNGSGNAYVTGATASADLPLASPIQSSRLGAKDAFLTVLAPSGSSLVFSTYLGGSAQEHDEPAVAVDGAGNAYVAGGTPSADFPLVNAQQPTRRGATDAFVAKIALTGGTTTASATIGEPGSGFMAAATGAAPFSEYTLALGTSEANCASGPRLGGPVVTRADGTIAPVPRTIPNNATPGLRYLCWVNTSDSSSSAQPVPMTLF